MSLVEIMASILVFAIVTLGMVPLIAAALRSASLARSFSVGKAITEKGMETIRSLPFYVSAATSGGMNVDVLDLYYPNLGPGYNAGTFTTTCNSASTEAACPRGIPPGYQVTISATFVKPADLDADGNQEFDLVVPPTGYTSADPAHDAPPTRILKVIVQADWSFSGGNRNYDLAGLVGERGFQTDRVRGDAVIDYSVQVLTGFKRILDGSKSYLISTMGSAESRIHTREEAEASQTASGGIIRLTRDDAVVGAGADLLTGAGATASYAAPPTSNPASGTTATEKTLVHPDIVQSVAFLDDSTTSGLKVVTSSTTSEAEGHFTINAQPLSAGDVLNNYVTNQAVTGAGSALKFAAALPMFSVRPPPVELPNCVVIPPSCGSGAAVAGYTNATSYPLSGVNRAVAANAKIERVGQVHLFPVTFLAGPITDQYVLGINNFVAEVNCSATPTGTPVAKAEWSATVRYWGYPPGSSGIGTAGNWQTYTITNAGVVGGAIDTLQDLKAANPKVWHDPLVFPPTSEANDIWLFKSTNPRGYLENATSLIAPPTEISDGNRYTSATIDGAIRLDTVPTDSTIPQSRLNVSIGKLACEAIDRR